MLLVWATTRNEGRTFFFVSHHFCAFWPIEPPVCGALVLSSSKCSSASVIQTLYFGAIVWRCRLQSCYTFICALHLGQPGAAEPPVRKCVLWIVHSLLWMGSVGLECICVYLFNVNEYDRNKRVANTYTHTHTWNRTMLGNRARFVRIMSSMDDWWVFGIAISFDFRSHREQAATHDHIRHQWISSRPAKQAGQHMTS